MALNVFIANNITVINDAITMVLIATVITISTNVQPSISRARRDIFGCKYEQEFFTSNISC